MNRYDWYFRQIISQGEMDQAFDWVAASLERVTQALLSDPAGFGGAWNGGILEGGAVTQQVVPDLSVRVSSLVAFDKTGRPIIESNAQTNVPVNVDEYGTSTVVPTPGESRILSVFVRYVTDLQTPTVDGNGLTVYTQELDDLEIFVRQGTAGVSPTAPPLLPDALLLADITLANGQTTILTGHIDVTRREDWLRLVGTSIPSFVSGTPREALRELFAYVDTAMGGGSLYTPTYPWYGAVGLGVVGGAAPTSVLEALDDIVQDLEDNTTGGDVLIGGQAVTGTPGARGDLSAGSVASKFAALANIVASHPAAAANVTGRGNWVWMLLSAPTGFSPGDMTSQAGGTATAVAALGASGWVLVHTRAGTWTVGQGVDYGAAYVAAEAYLLDSVVLADVITTTDLQSVLYAVAAEVARLSNTATEVNRYRYGVEYCSGLRQDHAHLGGAGHPEGPIEELREGYWTDDDEPAWPLPYQTAVSCAAGNLVSICRGWDYAHNAGCAYVVGDTLQLSRVRVTPFAEMGIVQDYVDLTIDAAGTLMSTLSPTRKTYAVACNGQYIYVLVGYGIGSPDAEVYAYDARAWRSNGLAQWVWTTAITTVANGLGNTKNDSNLVANKEFVVALLGAENCFSGNPLCRMDAADGANPTLGRGDGASGVGFTPSGGLAISRGNAPSHHRVFYTCWDTVSSYECVPALYDLTATGKPRMTLVDLVRDVVLVGRHVVLPEWDSGGAAVHFVRLWDYETNDTSGLCVQIQNTSASYPAARAAFDGTNIWVKFAHGLAGEQHVVAPVHAGEIVNCGAALSQVVSIDHRYLMTPPLLSGAIGTGNMGRFIAWGPGVFSIEGESSDIVNFLPLNRGVR